MAFSLPPLAGECIDVQGLSALEQMCLGTVRESPEFLSEFCACGLERYMSGSSMPIESGHDRGGEVAQSDF